MIVTFMGRAAEGTKWGFEVDWKAWASLWMELYYTIMEENKGGSDLEFLL